MKKSYKILLSCFLLIFPTQLNAKVNVFTCEPEWKSLVEEIGGKNVKAFSATNSNQDPHHIRARPSLISKIIKSKLVVCSGGGLEEGWLPILLLKARSQVQVGQIGNIMAIDYSKLIEIPETIDRSMGHIHPNGNSHVHLDPHNILSVAEEINKRLQLIDSKNANKYQTNFDNFSIRWENAIDKWQQKALALKGKNFIVHHGSLNYLFNWLNINIVSSLEVKPGLQPTISHLESLLIKIKGQQIDLIVRTSYEPEEASSWLSKKTSIPAIDLPYTVGGDKKSTDLFSLYNNSINILISKIK